MSFDLFAADLLVFGRWGEDAPRLALLALRLWPLWLPLLAGGAAIFLLLPRPRPYPAFCGAALGALALVLTGLLLVRTSVATPEAVLFYAFSAIALTAGVLLVTQRHPARAALSFALVVLSTCGLFLLLAAPFLTAATIIVYAGAIIVTFLFVIMLAQQAGLSSADARSREPLLATLTGFLLLAALLYVLQVSYGPGNAEIDGLLAQTREALDKLDGLEQQAAAEGLTPEAVETEINREINPAETGVTDRHIKVLGARGFKDLGERVLNIHPVYALRRPAGVGPIEFMRQHLHKLESIALEAHNRLGTVQPPKDAPLSALSGPPANTPPDEFRRDPKTGRPQLPAENSAYLGRALFTDFLLPVELAGTLLLVAAIGAIAIAQRRPATKPASEGPP
jgi:NADH:ubiquinone oxidoreductase subunit 6 (subunit J)